MKRILTLTLSVALLLSMLITDVGAIAVDYIYELDPKTGDKTEEIDYESTVAQYLTTEIKTAEEKLETMTMKYATEGYQLWVDELTGEVATKDLASGQILFSNPYDIGATYASGSGPSESTKKKIFSQIMIKYDDNGTSKTMYSFEEAALRGQITVKNIKGGIRVEYSVGREETRMLVPKVIEKSAFETKILDVFAEEINSISRENASEGLLELNWRDYEELTMRSKASLVSGNALWFNFMQLFAYYQLKAVSECKTEREKISMFAAYPITKTMDVYVFATDATQTEILKCENYIKTYVTSYTFEQLEIDHATTGYEGTDKNPPLFKLSLEYTLDDLGMSVRCPVNGLRFNESLYQLTYISILPYMGAASNYLLGDSTKSFTGYNFFPDGSGTIFRHESLAGSTTTTINAKVYGFDYAYNEITGNHAETVRYPVFGIVSNYSDTRTKTVETLVSEEIKDPVTGEVVVEAEYETEDVDYTYNEDRGFVAIIEEGDALAELSTYHEGALSKYNSVSMLFYPRPKDSYNLANALTVGANATWTVVSSRKYVGNYKIRYIMLTDAEKAKENNLTDTYEVSWMGMAEAYRDYLYSKGDLKQLTKEDVEEDIPAYIETFGATETLEKILSIPVNVMTSLTSFENVKTMYDELSAEGVSNIKFKLTGFANGGLFASIPYNLEWEDAVGGDDGFTDLLDYSAEKGFEVFPDFDFAYVRASTNTLFDGLTLKDHIVKSINNTYMSKRYYSATRQTMMGRFELAVSAAYYARFYEKLNENLLKYFTGSATKAISVATLGSALNSDFDEDEPYNREDTKKSTVKALETLANTYDDVMTESGNAYTWKYVDYILNLPLDSSRYTKSDASVPFIGVVLHGSKQFSGSPLNMEGNIGYSLLKAIENGAGVYFVLCYENYAVLKESPILSQYYSVRYDILKDDVVKYYNIVNDLTKDLQTSLITSHEFLIGERVPEAAELAADKLAAEKAAAEKEASEKAAAQADLSKSLLNGRITALESTQKVLNSITAVYNEYKGHIESGISVADGGAVSVYDSMYTLVTRAKNAIAANAAASEAKAEALNERNYAEALLDSLSIVATPIEKALTTGTLKTYKDLTDALAKAESNLISDAEKIEKQLAEVNEKYTTAIQKIVDAIPGLVKNYQAETNEEKKKTTLETIVLYAGSLTDAEEFAELKTAVSEYEKQLAAFEKANVTSDTYLALTNAVTEANAEYEAAKTVSDLYGTASYEKAADKVTAAQTAKKRQIDNLTARLKTIEKKLALYSEQEKEYQLIIELKAETEKELADLQDATKTNSYTEAIDAAYAELDAVDETLGAARRKAADAQAALDKNVADYAANYKSGADYKAVEAKLEAANNKIDTLTEKFKKISPIAGAYAEFCKNAEEKQAAYDERAALESGYIYTEKYKELRQALDTATAAANAATQAYNDGMTTNAKYLELLSKYQTTKAALEEYTLAYVKNDDYQPLKEAYDTTSAAINALLYAYKDTETYKTLEAAVTKATAELLAAALKVDTSTGAKIPEATILDLTAKLDAKAKAEAALRTFVEESENAVKATFEYKTLVKTATTQRTAIDNYVKLYTAKLDAAATESEKLAHPEETEAGRYAIAKKAFEEAESTYLIYAGEKVGAANYAAGLKNDAAVTKAETAKTAANKALTDYITAYQKQVKYTKETDIATITDSEIKAANAKWNAANDKYTTANTAFTESGTALGKLDVSLKTAVTSYYGLFNTKTIHENDLKLANKNVEVSSIKAAYEAYTSAYAALITAYEDAKAAVKTTNEVYTAATDAAKSAANAQKSALSAISTLNIKSKNATYSIQTYVDTARKNLADSKLALEVMGNDSTYAQSLRDELKETNAKVVELEQQVHDLTDAIVAYVKQSLTIAKESNLVEVDMTVNNPYAEKQSTSTDVKVDDGKYVETKYTDNSGNIVRVGYENGVVFFLNYNYFAVTTVYDGVTYELPAYGGYRLNADGTGAAFTAALGSEAE